MFPLGGYVKFAGEMYPDKIEKIDKKNIKNYSCIKMPCKKLALF